MLYMTLSIIKSAPFLNLRYPLVWLFCLSALPGFSQTNDENADVARKWRASMEEADRQWISGIKPGPVITGTHYVDTAYKIGFYFSPGDSIVNRSANGMALITIAHGFFYMRMSSVHNSSAVKTYADQQRDESKEKEPAGVKHYKVSKLMTDDNPYHMAYTYRITFTDKQDQDMVVFVRIQYGTSGTKVKLAASFPNDADAPKKEQKVNDFANTVSMW
jgi:hypothetical protein